LAPIIAFPYVQRVSLLIAAVVVLFGAQVRAEPPSKTTSKRAPSRAQVLQSANGWNYVNGEWVHPDGYKFVNNKIIRTTARTGKAAPKPPGALALENAAMLTTPSKPAANDAKTAAEKAAEERQKNLAPRPASQTGSHL
jgi:hypothetical protein